MGHEGHEHAEHADPEPTPAAVPAPIETIKLEFTPNPQTLKYVINRALIPRGTANFTASEAAAQSPLPRRLFALPGITGVMVGPTFVTVTRTEQSDPAAIHDLVHEALHAHFKSGEPAVDPAVLEQTGGTATDDAVTRRIREIIEDEVRPAVAMDGGDITFERFQDGVVYVYMKGSCSSCPSSTATLKGGIETRLKEEFPQINEVVQI